jgi:hypothetical protein
MKRIKETRPRFARALGGGVILVAILCPSQHDAFADIITLNTSDRGIYRDDGFHIPWYNLYAAGRFFGDTINHFLLFDLSSITQPVISAELRLVNNNSYDSPDPFETYTVFEVTSPLTDVLNAWGDTVATFNDLGSGTVYGSVNVPSNNAIVTVSLFLNSAGLEALNASLGGLFIVGGAVTSLDSPEARYEGLFSLSNHKTAMDGATQIVLTTIPEPGTICLLAMGALALSAWQTHIRRRRIAG